MSVVCSGGFVCSVVFMVLFVGQRPEEVGGYMLGVVMSLAWGGAWSLFSPQVLVLLLPELFLVLGLLFSVIGLVRAERPRWPAVVGLILPVGCIAAFAIEASLDSSGGYTTSFSLRPATGQAPLTVSFTDTSTGAITNRFWDFGDGSTTNTSAFEVAHTYSAGVPTVTLIVSGPRRRSTNTETRAVIVTNAITLPSPLH